MQGEDLAVRYLRRHGFRILERNACLGRYELDIIAREGDTTAFIEVKTRRNPDALPPETNVTKKKQLHILRAAHRYMAEQADPDAYYRFDIVAVVIPHKGRPTVELYRDAFGDGATRGARGPRARTWRGRLR